ncbi:hypothetical protein [Roseibium aggregatum]|uniref:Glutathione import ATP-binding protein GsiA n=2 Tax=Stappiaceae TaxID=2821832 RepID=A0A0M6YAT1_9HYPH|nr:hypothetical protein [Roseibium aggregatum]CTQ46798.1 Glutathione import ATP-binding protein GsiA [Roseibium aggregatum]
MFISHDLRVVSRVASRVVILRSGKVVEEGETSRLFTAPEDAYTRELMDAIPGQRRLHKQMLEA